MGRIGSHKRSAQKTILLDNVLSSVGTTDNKSTILLHEDIVPSGTLHIIYGRTNRSSLSGAKLCVLAPSDPCGWPSGLMQFILDGLAADRQVYGNFRRLRDVGNW
jgi:hypothetical protein